MATMDLALDEDALDKLKERAADAGKRVEDLVTELVLAALHDEHDLDDDESRAVIEGIADAKAGRWVSHDEMMRQLREQRGR